MKATEKKTIMGMEVDVLTEEEKKRRGAAVNAKFHRMTAEQSKAILEANAYDPKRLKKTKK